MTSQKKIEANRRNGALSKGPVSREGKARSAMNAIKHGYTSEKIVLSTEEHEPFHRMLHDFTEHYNPLTAVEEQYVLEMCWHRWRMHRIWNAESVAIEREIQMASVHRTHEFHAGVFPNDKTAILLTELAGNGCLLDKTSLSSRRNRASAIVSCSPSRGLTRRM